MQTELDPVTLPPRRGLRLLLPDHHRRLEAMCDEMLATAWGGDSRDLVTRWAQMEMELLDHMAAEEEVILPGYAVHAPDDARRILDEHARIRELLTPMGVDVELHETHVTRLVRLVDALNAHAHHEDAVMYPWAETNLSEVSMRLLFVRVSSWLGT